MHDGQHWFAVLIIGMEVMCVWMVRMEMNVVVPEEVSSAGPNPAKYMIGIRLGSDFEAAISEAGRLLLPDMYFDAAQAVENALPTDDLFRYVDPKLIFFEKVRSILFKYAIVDGAVLVPAIPIVPVGHLSTPDTCGMR